MRRLDVKIVLVLFVCVFIPLGVSVYLVQKAINTSLGVGLNQDILELLEKSFETHRDYIELTKASVRERFARLSDSAFLATVANDTQALRVAVQALLKSDPFLRSVQLSGVAAVSFKVESEQRSIDAALRTIPLEGPVQYGPYNHLRAVFAVETWDGDAYRRSAEGLATYQALVRAPADYLGSRFVWVYLTILGGGVVLSLVIGILWARRLARRIHRLGKATAHVATGDLSVRVEPGSMDEVGRLVESFNSMVTELGESRSRIGYLQKISAWQEMARRLAHEIKNPLTPIQLAAQQLKEKYTGDDPAFRHLLGQSTEIIQEEVATLRRLTADFSAFAKLPELRLEAVDMREFIDECEATQVQVVENEGIKIAFFSPPHALQANVDRVMLKRVVDNLIRNATEAMKGSRVAAPLIRVEVAAVATAKGAEVRLTVADCGPGIPPEHYTTVFEPYYTTKSEGTGLGLAICKKIALEHGGRIWVENRKEGGAMFSIALPLLNKDVR